MEIALLIVTHISVGVISFALGHFKGYNDAQPKRGEHGRFTKKD